MQAKTSLKMPTTMSRVQSKTSLKMPTKKRKFCFVLFCLANRSFCWQDRHCEAHKKLWIHQKTLVQRLKFAHQICGEKELQQRQNTAHWTELPSAMQTTGLHRATGWPPGKFGHSENDHDMPHPQPSPTTHDLTNRKIHQPTQKHQYPCLLYKEGPTQS